MGYKQLVEDMKSSEKRYLLDMGAGHKTFRKKYGVTRDEVKVARKEARKFLFKTVPVKNFPKILVMDIETAPVEAQIWSAWKQNTYPEQITSQWFMLTWSAKWLFASEVMSDKLTPDEAKTEDDSRLVKSLWNLFNEADMVIAHNGDRFDVPKANTRFLMNGLPPTSSYRQIDTKKIAAKQFGFIHNSLNGLAKQFGFTVKMDTDFDLWKRCRKGDPSALEYMEIYNRHDVTLLEEVYLKLRPWIKAHPNVGVYINSKHPVCSVCGSRELSYTGEFYYTQTGKYPEYRCKCGALTRARTTVYDKTKRKSLLTSVAQ